MHSTGDEAPDGDVVKGGHGEQRDGVLANVFLGQLRHALCEVAATSVENIPGLHVLHVCAPTSSWYVPSVHQLHLPSLSMNVPTGQSMCARASVQTVDRIIPVTSATVLRFEFDTYVMSPVVPCPQCMYTNLFEKNARFSGRVWEVNRLPSLYFTFLHAMWDERDAAFWNTCGFVVRHQIIASMFIAVCFSIVVCCHGGAELFQYRGRRSGFCIVYGLACYSALMLLFAVIDVTLYAGIYVVTDGLWF